MSGPSPTRADRHGLKKTAGTPWWAPPPDVGLYTAVPDVAPDFRSGLSTLEWAVYQWMTDPRNGAKQLEDKAWTFEFTTRAGKPPAYGLLANALRISRSSVCRMLRHGTKHVGALIDKGAVQVRAVYAGRDAAKGKGRRVRTIYYMPPWAKVLEYRRSRPDVVLTAAGHPVIFGRRRLPMTQEQAAAWHLDLAAAPANPRRERKPWVAQGPSVTDARPPKGATLAEMPAADTLDEQAVLARLLAYSPANADDARDVLAAARGAVPEMPIEAVLEEIDSIWQRKAKLQAKGDRRPINAGWFLARMPSHAAHWQTAESARARERERAVKIERESRINFLAQAIGRLDADGRNDGRTAPLDEFERTTYVELIEHADEADVTAARDLLSKTRSRTA